MPATPFTVADYLLTRLQQLGVSDVFQVPGDLVKHFSHSLELFDGVRVVSAINELDAAYAADAYGRTRGLAALALHEGAGSFRALNAIAGAFMERSPVVIISACHQPDRAFPTNPSGLHFHHPKDNLHADHMMYGNITAGVETLVSAAGAGDKIDALLVAALTHKRPVYLACLPEVWATPCVPPPATPLQAVLPTSEANTLASAVEFVWSQLNTARRPLILAGAEVLRFGLSGLLQQLIDASGFLYTTTTLGKTVLDETGPKFIGTYSDRASLRSVIDVVTEADCILCFGAIFNEDYQWLLGNKSDMLVQSGVDSVRMGYCLFENVTLQDFMTALLQRFTATLRYPLRRKAPPLPVHPEPWVSNLDPRWSDHPAVLTYNRFFEHLTRFMTERGLFDELVLVLGVSSSLYVAANATGMKQGSFIGSAARQSIGFETGATCGAQLGSGKRAWTIAGDGGFMMVCQSLSTLARNRLNSVIFVMSNGVFAIDHLQAHSNVPDSDPQVETADLLPKWDYLALAQAFGAKGFRATTPAQLDDILVALLQITHQPALVEVVIPLNNLPQQMARMVFAAGI